jgi:uncharacterized protein (DUF302 family)
MTDFTLTTTVTQDFVTTVDKVRSALSEQGFGVITEIDMSATHKTKLDVDIPPQIILGACRPELAHRAIEANPSIAALLPCNVVVRTIDSATTAVEVFDPTFMANLATDNAIETVAHDASLRLRAMLAAITKEN